MIVGKIVYGEPLKIPKIPITDDYFLGSKEAHNAYMFNKLKMDLFRKKNPLFVEMEKDIYNSKIIFIRR